MRYVSIFVWIDQWQGLFHNYFSYAFYRIGYGQRMNRTPAYIIKVICIQNYFEYNKTSTSRRDTTQILNDLGMST